MNFILIYGGVDLLISLWLIWTFHCVNVFNDLNGISLGFFQRLNELLCGSLLSVLSFHLIHDISRNGKSSNIILIIWISIIIIFPKWSPLLIFFMVLFLYHFFIVFVWLNNSFLKQQFSCIIKKWFSESCYHELIIRENKKDKRL